MGVDGIGGPRGPLTPPGGGGAAGPGGVGPSGGPSSGVRDLDGAGSVGRSGDVSGVGAAGAAEVDRARLVRGELSLDQYLELQVEHATAHLVDQAPPAVLEEIRGALRQELAADPVLLSLTSRLGAG